MQDFDDIVSVYVGNEILDALSSKLGESVNPKLSRMSKITSGPFGMEEAMEIVQIGASVRMTSVLFDNLAKGQLAGYERHLSSFTERTGKLREAMRTTALDTLRALFADFADKIPDKANVPLAIGHVATLVETVEKSAAESASIPVDHEMATAVQSLALEFNVTLAPTPRRGSPGGI